MSLNVPNYLKAYADDYKSDPRAAATRWFREARYGLFMHYGLYSLIGRHEWVQCREKIRVDTYASLLRQFTAEGFDAEAICDLAVDAGMKYVNLTTRHHDSFCLFGTGQTEFNSLNAPCGRDLVGELAAACDKRALGLCLYYSHGRDWRHPHAPNNDHWGGAPRPKHDRPDPAYAVGPQHDLQRYVDFMTEQIRELLTHYGPIAAIWLDGIAVPLSGDYDQFRCPELYDLIHSLQPQVLVSYKQGLTHTEDFYAPEREAVQREGGRPMEICTTMQPKGWGYILADEGSHKTADEVWETLREAGASGCNLLLNTGPLPDGSIHPHDAAALRAVGERLRNEGFPE